MSQCRNAASATNRHALFTVAPLAAARPGHYLLRSKSTIARTQTWNSVSTPSPTSARRPAPAQSARIERLRNLIEEIELADQVGLDVFGLGEHHRPDYAASAPAVALAAAAERTKRIRLTSAVTVLSSDDPVRVFQQFATLDLLSGGRAEIMAGRGSFIESFPLFGYDLERLRRRCSPKSSTCCWSCATARRSPGPGNLRAPINDRGVYPRPYQEKLPIWIAVGGTPQSVVRAGTLGLPLALAIIGGEPARFAPLFELYREAARRAGHDPDRLATSLNVHGFIAETTEQAADDFYGPQAEVMNRIGRERGWGPTNRAHFDQSRGAARRAVRRRSRNGRRKDRRPAQAVQQRPLPAADGDRHDAARQDHEGDRTLRHQGRAARAPRDGRQEAVLGADVPLAPRPTGSAQHGASQARQPLRSSAVIAYIRPSTRMSA